MTALTDNQIKNTYQGLIQVPGGVTSALKTMEDGLGAALPVKVNQTIFQFSDRPETQAGGPVALKSETDALATAVAAAGDAKLNVAQTWNKAQRSKVTYITDDGAVNLTLDLSVSNCFFINLSKSRYLTTPTNMVEGQSGYIDVLNNGHAFTYDTATWEFPDNTTPVFSQQRCLLFYEVLAYNKIYCWAAPGFNPAA